MSLFSKLFGKSEPKDPVDQALDHLERVAVPVRVPKPKFPSLRAALDRSADTRLDGLIDATLKAAGHIQYMQYTVHDKYVRFVVDATCENELERLASWLESNKLMPDAKKRIYHSADFDKDAILRVPLSVFNDLPLVLILAARQEPAGVGPDLDGEGECDENEITTEIDVHHLNYLLAVDRASRTLVHNAEYRVNHVFTGDSKSYYVRFDDLEVLKEALASK